MSVLNSAQLYNSIAAPGSKAIVMAIINLTNDSFYDGGRYRSDEAIRNRIHQVISEGASIIDFGACSTRPGAREVEIHEELDLLVRGISMLRENYSDFPVSLDTYRAEIVQTIHTRFGETWINDISGGAFDSDLHEVVKELNLPYILMHIQGTPATMQQAPSYQNVVEEVFTYLQEKAARLESKGISKLLLDPGFGFGKTVDHNFKMLANLQKLTNFGRPVLAGISRKSMIYKLLGTSPDEALNGTTALNILALQQGVKILRVHDVKEAVECLHLWDKVSFVQAD